MIQSAALIFPSTFLATYGWAVSLGHADKIWPYISDTGDDDDGDDGDDDDDDGDDGDDDDDDGDDGDDGDDTDDHDDDNNSTGTVPPESCFFGQMLNIGALLLVITFFIR